MKRVKLPLAFVLGMLFCTLAAADDAVSFRRQVAPLLRDNCLACHGPKKAEGGYRVDSFERLMADGDSGAATFTAKDVDDSETFRRLVTDEESERMPLDGEPLSADQIDIFRRWIEQGARFDGDDPKAALTSIIPPPTHPAPPETYPFTMPITAMAFHPEGKELVVAGYHELTIWDPSDGRLVRRLNNIGERTHAIAFSPDGSRLVAAGGSPGRLGETRVFDAATGKLLHVLGTTGDVVLDVAFRPDGKQLAVGGADGVIRVFDVESGEEVVALTSHSDWVSAVAWSDDGGKLASASRDKTAKVFDVAKSELLATYSGHGEAVRGAAFHPGGAEVYSSGADKKIHRWKIADGKKAGEVAFGGEVFKIPRDGAFLFATSADKSVRQFDAKTQKLVRNYSGHADWTLAAAFHAKTKRLASGGFDGEVRVWNAEDGKLVVRFTAAPGIAKPSQ